jgi:hypothetical protein
VGGFGVTLRTLSGLSGNKPQAAHAFIIFLSVNAFSLAGLYKEVKCCLPTVFAPPWNRLLGFEGLVAPEAVTN